MHGRCFIRRVYPQANGTPLAAFYLCVLEAPTFPMNTIVTISGAPVRVFR
jgi:hypothetical protein